MESLFFERFCALCKAHNESPNAAARAIGKSSGSVTAWKKGTLPRYETMKALADRFGVSVDYLAGNTTDPQPEPEEPQARSRREDLMFALFQGREDVITDEMYDEILHFADYVIQREQSKKMSL